MKMFLKSAIRIVLFIEFFSASLAFGMHAYRTAECSGLLPNGKNLRFAFASGSYPMAILSEQGPPERSENGYVMNTVNILGTNLEFTADDEPAKLVLKVRREIKVKSHNSWQDACWRDMGSDFSTVVEVQSVTPELGLELGIRSGTNILLDCGDNITSPGGHCRD